MKKLLIIGKVWPEPLSSAAGTRMMQLIAFFRSSDYRITFASPAATSKFSADLIALKIDCVNIQINDNSFNDFIKALHPDLILFDRFTTEEQFSWRVIQECPAAIRILDTEDLHCLRAARQTAVKENRTMETCDLNSVIAKREIASIFRSDLSLIISTFEMDLLQKHFRVSAELLHYLPMTFDPIGEKEISSWKSFEAKRDFICIGNFLHEPNWDAVKYLKSDIWPLIRKKLPTVNVNIYGSYPIEKVFALNDIKNGFIIRGRAESSASAMSENRICLAPLRFGAGIKGKLLEAMQNGTPSITTPIGAEAMYIKDWCGQICTTPEDFAQAAITLYQNQADWQQARQVGIEIHNELFDKDKHLPLFTQRLSKLETNLQLHREKNFIGAMLLHHTAQSTKFMSLWIEAKNVKKIQDAE